MSSNIGHPQNAFAKLDKLDFNQMLVVDLLHEYELGIWKSLFAHLVRILESVDGNAVEELNARYAFFDLNRDT